jgi:hypothetical protein
MTKSVKPKDFKSKSENKDELSVASKRGKRKPFTVGAFEESINFAKELYKLGAGEKVRRLTLFDTLRKSPDSGSSRMLIVISNKYGLTKGSYVAEFLELTPNGLECVSDEQSPVIALKAKFELAVSGIEVYNYLYTKFVGNKLPSISVIKDLIVDEYKTKELDSESATEVVETFIVNIKYLGLLQTISGAERVISLEHALEKISKTSSDVSIASSNSSSQNFQVVDLVQVNNDDRSITTFEDFNNICFYITPIGDENSEFRKHSDLFLETIITPAIQQFNMKVVRADQIDKPGTITNQIIEYIIKAKLVIADLSFHNPNVFYELALRHACRLPTVQIIRKADRIPFDVSQSRTITIDTTDIYSLVPKIEIHKAEIASQVRQALNNVDAIDNPLTNVFPKMKLQF